MPTDPVTEHAVSGCDDCGLLTIPPVSCAAILERLPPSLFNRSGPSPGEPGAIFEDVFADISKFGVVVPGDTTPQYEIVRHFAQEKGYLLLGLRQAVALQLGLGRMGVEDGQTVGQCPHATGSDLDRVGEQYGVGRPPGFTDCCYWRLVVLLLFSPGTVAWCLGEIAALYTGVRPAITERPLVATLTWPAMTDPGLPATYWDYDDGFYDATGFWTSEDSETLALSQHDSYWRDGESDPEVDSFWFDTPLAAPGLRLEEALDMVKAAGVHLEYVNRPRSGRRGCGGATYRGLVDRRGRWVE